MQIHETAEMYLENILVLSKEKSNVRSIDIAKKMNYSKPTVSVFIKNLKNDGFIKVDSNGFITLEDKGLKIAKRIYGRHTSITKFLVTLGVDEKTAAEDACKMEHDISEKSFKAMKKYVKENS